MATPARIGISNFFFAGAGAFNRCWGAVYANVGEPEAPAPTGCRLLPQEVQNLSAAVKRLPQDTQTIKSTSGAAGLEPEVSVCARLAGVGGGPISLRVGVRRS